MLLFALEFMRILVDMDGVLTDFNKAAYLEASKMFPDAPDVKPMERAHFYLEEDYPKEFRAGLRKIPDLSYFYTSLEPIPGGLEALTVLSGAGHDVRICTSPSISNYLGCVSGKFMWVHRYFGDTWLKRMIVTKDKTIIGGDILIDDKPVITGAVEPSWEHVLYDQPYNRNIEGKRRLDWNNWKEVLNV